jgi:hypothetical protein
VFFSLFLTVKDRASDTFDLYDRANAAWAQNSALRVPVKSGCKVWNYRTSDQETLCIAPCPNSWPLKPDTLKIFSGVKRRCSRAAFINDKNDSTDTLIVTT